MTRQLKVIQLKELFDICLGLDVIELDFFEGSDDFSLISRHHLDLDTYWYTLFEFDKKGNWKIKLVPLEYNIENDINNPTSHDIVHGNTIENELARRRLTHLYKIMQKYDSSVSKETLRDEFSEGIWNGLSQKVREDWIERFYLFKSPGEDRAFYQQKNREFYSYIYNPVMNDFGLFLMGGNLDKDQLFWMWFYIKYLKVNKYPKV